MGGISSSPTLVSKEIVSCVTQVGLQILAQVILPQSMNGLGPSRLAIFIFDNADIWLFSASIFMCVWVGMCIYVCFLYMWVHICVRVCPPVSKHLEAWGYVGNHNHSSTLLMTAEYQSNPGLLL